MCSKCRSKSSHFSDFFPENLQTVFIKTNDFYFIFYGSSEQQGDLS